MIEVPELKVIFQFAHESFERENHAREEALSLARESIRFSANSIRAAHRSDSKEARRLLKESEKRLRHAQERLAPFPRIYFAGFLEDAEKEFAEASITIAIIEGKKIPLPQKLSTGLAPFLRGLGEAASEVRRHILDLIRHGELSRGEELLDVMDDIFYLLASVDYPEALTGGLRRTTDMLRSVLERTRGDLTVAIRRQSLEKRIEELEEKLEKKEN